MSEWAFVGELDVGCLVDELEKRGAKAAALEVDVDAGRRRTLSVSFAVPHRLELEADAGGFGLLRDALRVTFTHRAVESERLARRRR